MGWLYMYRAPVLFILVFSLPGHPLALFPLSIMYGFILF